MDNLVQELDIRTKFLEQPSQCFLWKIDSYTYHKEKAKDDAFHNIQSPSFYTSTNGYRMHCKLYLNGDGKYSRLKTKEI